MNRFTSVMGSVMLKWENHQPHIYDKWIDFLGSEIILVSPNISKCILTSFASKQT
jgi:hypothetical protein